MLSFYNVWTVARFEVKTLLRSWFFRIFAGISVAILILMNLLMLTGVGNTPWQFRGISSSIPYGSLLLLNVAQAVIAVFLASDFLKRDKKLDTTEVVYMRSMTNGDYVLGKTLGIFLVFMALNFAALLVVGIFNLFCKDVPLNLPAYFYYPLLISVPTLVFIFGLSFLLMVLIRNQAVTFIVLLGYIATTLFFLGKTFHYLFDYMAFNVPMMYSDFVGFGNLTEILIHRGIYFSLGISFIFATILLLRRLPQSVLMQRVSLVLTVIFLSGGVVLGSVYLSRLYKGSSQRQKMVDLNNQLITAPKVTLTHCYLDLKHLGDKIQVNAMIVFRNETSKPIDQYIFTLNPGLHVREVHGQANLPFHRDSHIFSVQPTNPLEPQSTDSLTIRYDGKISEEACYLDVEDAEREKLYRVWLFNVDKRYSFVTSGYVLLSPESMWYPASGVGYSSDRPEYHTQDFVQFRLNVTTDEDLTALSQGKVTVHGSGKSTFEPEHPLPQLSLAIGPYEKRSITVDSVAYNLFTMPKHDYFTPYFQDLGDTLTSLIRDMKQDFEGQLNLTYAYPRLSLIEVPIQFLSYRSIWTVSRETVQPEMVFLPEKGILLQGADFAQSSRWEQRRSERSNQVSTPTESQSQLFRRFATSTFMSEGMMSRFRRRGPFPGLGQDNSYVLYPNYYTFVNYLKSERWPMLNLALESFLSKQAEDDMFQSMRSFMGLSDQERANLALSGHTLVELMADPDKRDVVHDVLESKGDYLFTLLQSKIGTEALGDFLEEILTEYRFRTLDVNAFNQALKDRFNFDFIPHIDRWYSSRQSPGFLISDIRSYQVLDGDRTRSQVIFTVSNPEPTDGLLNVSFRTGRPGGPPGMGGPRFMMGSGDADVERIVSMSPNQSKEVGVVLDSPPRMMTVNTLISKNLPSIISHPFEKLELSRSAVPFDGERILDHSPQLLEPHAIVVDNEDEGFQVYNPTSTSFLKRLFRISPSKDEEKYIGVRFWRPSTKWVATTGSDFYGKYIRSAYYTRAGNGDRKVAWNTMIPESGNYDIYSYANRMRQFPGRRRRESDEQYHFLVYHDDGFDEVILDMKNAESGWNFLGTFHLSADSARVELTNESQGRIVFADAVKWVKH